MTRFTIDDSRVDEGSGEGRVVGGRMAPSLARRMQQWLSLPQGRGGAGRGVEGGAEVVLGSTFERCYVPARSVRVVHGENCDCELRRDAAQVAENIAVWGLLTGCAVAMVIAVVQAAWRGWA